MPSSAWPGSWTGPPGSKEGPAVARYMFAAYSVEGAPGPQMTEEQMQAEGKADQTILITVKAEGVNGGLKVLVIDAIS